MRCCPCGAWEHLARPYTAENGSVHIQLNGTCRRCPCGWPKPEPAYGCIAPGTVVRAPDAVAYRLGASGITPPAEFFPPSWIRVIFKWTVDADGSWITEGGSIYLRHGGLHLSPGDTAIVSSILQDMVPTES